MNIHRSSFRFRRVGLLALVGWACLALSCGRYEVQTRSTLEEIERSSYPTLIMVPPRLAIEHEPYQAYQYAADVVERLTLEGRVPVVAPWEYDPDGDLDPRSAPQVALVSIADERAISLTDLAVLALDIEGSFTSTSVQTPAMLGGGLDHHYRSDVTVALAVRQFPHGPEIARVEVRFEDDPLAEGATAANPHPIIREGLAEACDELIGLLEDAFGNSPRRGLDDVDLLANHRLMFTYEAGADRSLADELASTDELDRLVAEHVYYQYFDPEMSGATLRLFGSTEPGILVLGSSGLYDGLLEPGDYITRVGEREAAGVQVLARSLVLSAPGDTVEIAVRRDDRIVRIPLPVLPDP